MGVSDLSERRSVPSIIRIMEPGQQSANGATSSHAINASPCQQGYGPVTLAVNAPCAKRRMRHTFGHAIDAGGLAVEAVAQFSVARGVQACPVRRINAPLSAFYVKHEQMDTLGKKGAQRGVCFIFGHSIARTARFPCFQPRETGGFAFLTFLDIFIYF